MGKYIDTELLIDLIRICANDVEETIDKMDPNDIEAMQSITAQGIDAGMVDPGAADIPYQDVVAGMGIMNMAMNMVRTVETLLAKPNVKRSVIFTDDKKIKIVETEMTETEITRNMNDGFAAMERFLQGITSDNENNNNKE